MRLFVLNQKGLDAWRNDYEKIKDSPPVIFSIFLLARALGFKVALEKDITEKLKKEENEAISNIINLNNLEYANQLLGKGEKSLDITDLFKI